MAAVVVAIKNKRYDAKEAEAKQFSYNSMLSTFPPENERKAEHVMLKYMIDGFEILYCILSSTELISVCHLLFYLGHGRREE